MIPSLLDCCHRTILIPNRRPPILDFIGPRRGSLISWHLFLLLFCYAFPISLASVWWFCLVYWLVAFFYPLDSLVNSSEIASYLKDRMRSHLK